MGLIWPPRFCVSNKFPGDTDVGSPGSDHTLRAVIQKSENKKIGVFIHKAHFGATVQKRCELWMNYDLV